LLSEYGCKEVVMMHWGNYGWGMGFGWIIMVLIWAMVFLTVYISSRAVSRTVGKSGHEETPLDLLKKRYVKGDIIREEFGRMRDNITKS
jgi:putative membrane protein